ncbi:50S ribosomal protein L25/general stress protein Ctc [Magnetofaba australis]|uniref:Large ribosomal subunit protein bL25 n=1 Tax=Magnetofaba australis IT-1 TaxID=1434232 RepID=A0A1Y2K5G7_9PROT|nr:50S ribosomal protein L25/general stress protein Ctc [Magnetofaba australis]OSM04254.1 putative 50S ribosomal protein L25 [Magnetofaba australis IT-1]
MATFEAQLRTGTGKGVARKMRVTGEIPGVVYGAGQENKNLILNRKDFTMTLIGEGENLLTHIHDLVIDGASEKVLVRGLQKHPVTDAWEHVDFLRFNATKRIFVKVPVHIVDEEGAPGLKRGGIVQTVRHELEVQCPAGSIPESIDVSVGALDIGESVHINDITLPEGVKVFTTANFTIAAMVGVKGEEAAADEGEDEGEAAE